MVLRFLYFENNRLNLFIYFAVTTIVLLLGPERFVPGWKKSKESPLIEAPCGSLVGLISKSRNGRIIDSYRGIPYAKPPVGSLRFARPEPFEDPAWDGVLEAKENGPSCIQSSKQIPFLSNKGQEDCLVLNVYRPADIEQPEGLLPVMVWFHGGGFVNGNGGTSLYGPGYLLDRDVILVTSNYRLGVLGFLTLGKLGEDHDIQGNQGLWDQVEVLKWVRKNIRSFGGDPKRVTIFGESAGGMSISYHLVSKASRGLFQAAIVQSGPLYAPFIRGDQNKPLPQVHTQYAGEIGCPIQEGKLDEAVKCLRSKTPAELASKMFMFDQCNLLEPETMPFPAVWSHSDDSSYAIQPFFSDDPFEVMRSNAVAKVPTMIGFTKNDGLINTANMLKMKELFSNFRDNMNVCAPTNFLAKFYDKISPQSISVGKQLKEFYLGQGDDFTLEGNFENLTNLFTDSAFAIGSDLMVRDLSSKGRQNIFYYLFEHQGSFSVGDVFSSSGLEMIAITLGKIVGYHWSKNLGVCHADDIFYLFSSDLPWNFLKGEEDERMIDLMVDLWSNFAIFHDPTPPVDLKSYQETQLVSGDSLRVQKWPSVEPNSDEPLIARLGNGQVVTEKDPSLTERLKFWHQHAAKYLV